MSHSVRFTLFPAILFALSASLVAQVPQSELKTTVTFKGHTDPIYAVAYSPDGKIVATGSFDKSIKLWDAATGKELRSLAGAAGHQSLVLSIAFNAAGDQIASGGADNFARIWDVPSGKPSREIAMGGKVAKVAVSADGKTLSAASDDGKIRVWTLADGKALGESVGHIGAVTGLALTPNGQSILSTGVDRTLRVTNALNGLPISTVGVGPVAIEAMSVTANGANVYTTSADGILRVWPSAALPSKKLFDHTAPVRLSAISNDGNFLLTVAVDKSVKWSNAVTGAPVMAIPPLASTAESLAIAANNALIALGTTDGKLLVIATGDGKMKGEFFAHTGAVRAVTFHPNGTQIATAGDDGLFKTWALPLNPPKALAHADVVTVSAIHPDGKRVITGGNDKQVRIWNNGNPEKTLAGCTTAVTAMSVAGDVTAAGETNGTVRLWTISSGQPAGVLVAAHPKSIAYVAISADGQTLATSDATGPIKLWKLPLGKGPKFEPSGSFALKAPLIALEAIAGQPQFLAVEETGIATTFDKITGKTVVATEALKGKTTAYARMSTGAKAAFAVSDAAISKCIVRGADGKTLKEIIVAGPVEALAISANGTRLIAGIASPQGRTVRAYDVDTGRELQGVAVAAAVRNLGIFADNKTLMISLVGDKSVSMPELVATSTLPGHIGGVRAAAFLPNGQIVAVGADKLVKLWDLPAMKEIKTYGTLTEVGKSLAISRDATVIAVSAGKSVKIWQTADAKELPFPALPFEPTSLSFSPDRTKLLIGSPEKAAWLYDVATGQPLQFFPQNASVNTANYHPTQPFVVVGSDDNAVTSHPISATRFTKDADLIRGPIAMVPNTSQILTTGAGNIVTGWNPTSGAKERTLEVTGPSSAIAVSRNATLVAVASAADNSIQIFTLNDNKLAGSFKAAAKVSELAFHPNGQMLSGVIENNTVVAWNVIFTQNQPLPPEFGSVVQVFPHPAKTTSLAFVGEAGQQLITGCHDGIVRVWKVASDQPVKSFPHPNLVDAVAFDKTGTLLATAGHDGLIRTFDVVKGGQPLKQINAHLTMMLPQPIYTVVWTPDSKALVSASFDKSIKIWDATSGTLIREIKGYPDTPPVATAPPATGHRDQVFCLAFTKDGKFLASGSSDRSIKLWDFATGNLVREFVNPNLKTPNGPAQAHPGFVHAVKFSADDKTLISAGTAPRNQGYLAVWNVADGKLIAAADVATGPIYSFDLAADGVSVLIGCGPKNRTAPESDAYIVRIPGK